MQYANQGGIAPDLSKKAEKILDCVKTHTNFVDNFLPTYSNILMMLVHQQLADKKLYIINYL